MPTIYRPGLSPLKISVNTKNSARNLQICGLEEETENEREIKSKIFEKTGIDPQYQKLINGNVLLQIRGDKNVEKFDEKIENEKAELIQKRMSGQDLVFDLKKEDVQSLAECILLRKK